MKDFISTEIWICREMSQCCKCVRHVLLCMKINWETNLRVMQIVIEKTMHSKWLNFRVVWGMWGVWNAMSDKQFRKQYIMLFGILWESWQAFGCWTVYCTDAYTSRVKKQQTFSSFYSLRPHLHLSSSLSTSSSYRGTHTHRFSSTIITDHMHTLFRRFVLFPEFDENSGSSVYRINHVLKKRLKIMPQP